MSDIYTEELKKAVEARYGAVINTTKQFEILRLDIAEALGETLSASTLKRIWDYVEGWQRPRQSTLDVLARYAGAASFADFIARIRRDRGEESGFSETDTLQVSSISPGTMVELTWMPDRRVLLRYEGDFRWTVTSNENSKLAEGAAVWFPVVAASEPLYADVALPGTSESRPYIAGKESGVCFRLL